MIYQLPNPSIPGWMSEPELQWLFDQAQTHESIVEIGCWMGRSTHALLSGNLVGFTNTGAVYAVDHFLGSEGERDGNHSFVKRGDLYAEFTKNVGDFMNLTVVKGTSECAAENFAKAGADMVFIDGGHQLEEVLLDLRVWSPKVKLGGLLCGHDKDQDGVPEAVKQFFGYQPSVRIPTSFWAFTRTQDGWQDAFDVPTA